MENLDAAIHDETVYADFEKHFMNVTLDQDWLFEYLMTI